MFPAARNTLVSQIQFALIVDNLPWVRAFDTRRNTSEIQRLDATSALHSDEYLLQVGRATALADALERPPRKPADSAPPPNPDDDKTLYRLGKLAKEFPLNAGSYAHLARYMMVERIRVRRKELDTSLGNRSDLIRAQDFRMMEWAVRAGEVCDPNNAFWATLLATACFAYGKDVEGLNALERATKKQKWDAYIYEEVLGQWRLYSEAYGDNGAAQKVAPLSLIAFPHLQEIRQMGHLVRWYANQALQAGDKERAIRLRRTLARLGMLMRETAQWTYEALYGTDLFFTATTDKSTSAITATIRTLGQWEAQSQEFKNTLFAANKRGEWIYYRASAENACQLRNSVEVAREDMTSGLPPGIPLKELFGNWMAGVCLLQQGLSLGIFGLVAWLWYTRYKQGGGIPSRIEKLANTTTLALFLIMTSILFWGTEPTAQKGALWVLSLLLFTSRILQILYLRQVRRSVLLFSWQWDALVERWKAGTQARFLVTILLPMGIVLFLARPMLSHFHPVAVILSDAMDYARGITAFQALFLTVLSYGIPLGVVLLGGVWSLWRRESPQAGMLFALTRLTVPILACLFLGYLVLLNDTLRLDAEATRGINEAAQNDLHWILTHSPQAQDE
jgi:hypothetical protein